MKRNDIYNNLKFIQLQLQDKFGLNVRELNALINEIDIDRHKSYDEFECVEDIVDRLDQIDGTLNAIRSDIEFVRKGDFTKPWVKKDDKIDH